MGAKRSIWFCAFSFFRAYAILDTRKMKMRQEASRAMAFQDSPPEDIRATLAISQEEARLGSSRVINLPGGRTATVKVPAGIRDGEELRLAGQGLASARGGAAGDLVLRVSVIATDNFKNDPEDFSVTQSVPMPPPILSQASPASAASEYSAQATLPSPASAGGYTPPPPVYQQAPASGPQSYPGLGSYPNYPAYAPTSPAYTPPPISQPPRRRGGAVTALVLLLVLLLLLGSGLFFYFGYYQPDQAHIAGTATAQARTQATANAQASATAQVVQATAQAGKTATAQVQATTQAYQNLYAQATQGTPALNDQLNSQTGSQWDEINGSGSNSGSCSFSGGSYHSSIPTSSFFQPCYAENTNFSNFAFQVDMVIQQGDEGGIIFRADNVNDRFYLFQIDVNGRYSIYKYVDNQGSHALRLTSGTTNLMAGAGQSIQITLVAQNSTLSIYLNQHYLTSVSDGSYSSGKIGVFGESVTQPTDAAFNNAKVWTL
jgi:Flp pilus assembly protein TadG